MKTRDQIRDWFISQDWFPSFHKNFSNHRGRFDDYFSIDTYFFDLKIKKEELFVRAFPFVGQPEGVKFWSECSVQYLMFLHS